MNHSALSTFEAMRRREIMPLARENEAIDAYLSLLQAAEACVDGANHYELLNDLAIAVARAKAEGLAQEAR